MVSARYKRVVCSLLGAAVVGAAVLGCGAGTVLVARADDYEQFKRARLSPRFEARLRESWRYLRAFPNGAYREQVRAWFLPAEERWRAAAWTDSSALSRYLAVLPDGPFAEQVRARIAALESAARSAAQQEASLLRWQRERQAKLDLVERGRKAFRQEIVELVGELSRFDGFGSPYAGGALQRWLNERAVTATCEGALCRAEFAYEFEIPVAGQLKVRRLRLELEIHSSKRGVERLALSGHGLVERLHESSALVPVEFGDAQARAEAVGSVVTVLGVALEAGLPEARCHAEAVSPTLLSRRCDGRAAQVVLSEELSEPDRVEFSQSP